MVANNAKDHSLQRVIVLYQQELHNKLLQIHNAQQHYQLLYTQLQHLEQQEQQSYAVVKKAIALQQKSFNLIVPNPSNFGDDNSVRAERLRIDLTVQIARLNAYNLSLNRVLTNEALIDIDNKSTLLAAEKDIITCQLAMLEQFTQAADSHQQLLPLLDQQKDLANKLQRSGDTDQLLKEIQQQLPTAIAQFGQQSKYYQAQLADAQQQLGRISQNYTKALDSYHIARQQANDAQKQFLQAQQAEQKTRQQTVKDYQAILNKCQHIKNTFQEKYQQLQETLDHKTTLLHNMLDKRQVLKQQLEEATNKKRELLKNIERAKAAKQKLAAMQDSSNRRYSPETEITLQVALLKIETEINKAYLALDKTVSQIKEYLSHSLAYGENIRHIKRELPQLEENIIIANNNYQQILSDIERQKAIADDKQRQIMAQIATPTLQNRQKLAIASAAEQQAEKHVYQLQLLLQLVKYHQLLLQHEYSQYNANRLNYLARETDQQIEQRFSDLNSLWRQYQQLTNLIIPQRQDLQEKLNSCWTIAAQVRKQTDRLWQIIKDATQKLSQARMATTQLLTQWQQQQQETRETISKIQQMGGPYVVEIAPLLQTANKLIHTIKKVTIIPDTPYIATIPQTTILATYALDLDEPQSVEQPDLDPSPIKQAIRQIIKSIDRQTSHYASSNNSISSMPVSNSATNKPAIKSNTKKPVAFTKSVRTRDKITYNEIDIAFEQELRKRILADLDKH